MDAGLHEPTHANLRVGYVLSRFPKLTETFILYEILELQRQGVDVTIYSLVRERAKQVHPEASQLLGQVIFADDPWAIVRAQFTWLRRRPLTYIGLWWEAIVGNVRSPRFLVRALATIPMASYLATRMQKAKVDHIHAHWATHPTLAGLAAARLLNIRFSFTAHAHDLYVNRSMLGRKIRKAAFVATISEYNKRLLESLYPSESRGKTFVIRCGVDLNELRPQPRSLDAGTPLRIVCVASLEPQKGHGILVDAVAMLRDRGIEVRCELAGDGPQAHALRDQVARLGLGQDIELVGGLARPQILAALQDAEVMALASVPQASGKMEGIPVALMEGMAMQLPVVASDISGIPELVTDGVSGYLVPPGNARALADALVRIHADSERGRAMGAAGRARISELFELRANVALLRQHFDEAIAETVS
jgi:colanic acid/amylovoran biosynthesis glycosyltransferase